MRIVADENIPYALEHFGALGNVDLMPGRSIAAGAVREADVLFVRSVTRVGAELLEGSRVKFVGTATAGVEHIDRVWLKENGIAFADAAGSNAESVAQYVAAALVWAAGHGGRLLGSSSIGIIGVGHCGSRVARVARALGMRIVLCDPPLARSSTGLGAGDVQYRSLEEALACDYVTLHVPLTNEGADATAGMIGAAQLELMPAGSILIQASRGGVVCENALAAALDAGKLRGAILDVWQGEPKIDMALLDRAMLGTPHIAGYSLDGKLAGTRMVYEAACHWMGRALETPQIQLPAAGAEIMSVNCAGRTLEAVATEAILVGYPISHDAAGLREALHRDMGGAAQAFDERRRNYPMRREFAATKIMLRNAAIGFDRRLKDIGFNAEMVK